MQPFVRVYPVVLSVCALGCWTVSCRDGGGRASKPAEPAANKPAPPSRDGVIGCSAVPASMVGDVLGLPGLQQQSEKIEGKATLCQYEVPNAKQFVSIRIERGYDDNRFDPSKSAFPNATDVPGLGERAFASQLPMITASTPYGIHSIAVLKHHTHLTVSGPSPPDKIQYLAREILEGI